MMATKTIMPFSQETAERMHICAWCCGQRETLPLGMCRTHAAAPDLLAACKSLLDIIHDDLTHARQEDHRAALDAARAAIAKAEGN